MANYLESDDFRPHADSNPTMSSFRIFPALHTSIMVPLHRSGKWFAQMGDNAMSASMTTDSDIELFREDLVALKRDVASLIEHVKGGATDTVQDAAGQIKRRVRSLREEAGAQRDRSAKAVNLFLQNSACCCAEHRRWPWAILALACFGGEPILFGRRSSSRWAWHRFCRCCARRGGCCGPFDVVRPRRRRGE